MVWTYSWLGTHVGLVPMAAEVTGGAENPEPNAIPPSEGLFVGPAIGLVGSLASDSVTVRLCPFHPFVDSRSVSLGQHGETQALIPFRL